MGGILFLSFLVITIKVVSHGLSYTEEAECLLLNPIQIFVKLTSFLFFAQQCTCSLFNCHGVRNAARCFPFIHITQYVIHPPNTTLVHYKVTQQFLVSYHLQFANIWCEWTSLLHTVSPVECYSIFCFFSLSLDITSIPSGNFVEVRWGTIV